MKKQLRIAFLAAVCSLGLAGAAQAQYQLIVNQPTNLVGSVISYRIAVYYRSFLGNR